MIAALGLTALSLGVGVLAQGVQLCGEAPYWDSEYTCYDNSVLCPVTLGIPTLPCAGACYHKGMYECVSGSLRLLPQAAGLFGLTVQGSLPHLKNQAVKACGNYLAFGSGARECTSCANAQAQRSCSAYQNKTVLQPGGKMAAEIPGSQYWYVNATDGALMYTKGGEANGPETTLAGRGVTVYQNGFFTFNGSPFWLSCLRTLPGGTVGTARAYRIYAPTPDSLARTNCDQIKLVASAVSSGTEGAFKYN